MVALPAKVFQGGEKDIRPNLCNQKLARHHAHNICLVSALYFYTGNPNQNY